MPFTFTISLAGPGQEQVTLERSPIGGKYIRYLLPGGEYRWAVVAGAFLIFQLFVIGKYNLLFCHYLVDKPIKLIIRDITPGIRIYLMLEGSIANRYSNREWSTLREGYYELHSFSLIKKEIRLTPQTYKYIILHSSDDLTDTAIFSGKMSLEIVLFTYLLEQSVKLHSGLPQQLEIIHHLLQQVKDKKEFTGRHKYTGETVFRIWQSGNNIKKYMDEKDILREQFVKTHLKKGLYLEGFRVLFGLTPKAYQVKVRMEVAGKRIEENPPLSFSDVANIANYLGYSRPGDFVKAYKKYFGFHPLKKEKGL